jgi:hypothetical protein
LCFAAYSRAWCSGKKESVAPAKVRATNLEECDILCFSVGSVVEGRTREEGCVICISIGSVVICEWQSVAALAWTKLPMSLTGEGVLT